MSKVRSINYRRVMPFTRLLSLTILWLLLTSFIGAEQAQARMTLDPDPGPMPANLRNALETCDEPPNTQTPGFVQWIAQAGSPATTVLSVPYGTSSVNLEFHLSAAVCLIPTRATHTSHKIEAAYPEGTSGAAGKQIFLNYPPNPPQGLYRHGAIGFNYAPPGGFTASGDHYITLSSRGINRFSNGDFRCTKNGAVASSLTDYNSCPMDTHVFLIRVNVDPPPTLSCTAIDPAGGIETGQPPFDMRVSFKNAAGASSLTGATNLRFTLGSTPAQSYSAVPYSPNPLPAGGTATSQYRPINTPPPGRYSVTMEVTGGNSPGGVLNCPDLLVRSKPYFRVYGGDVLAGMSGFGTCVPTPGGGIFAYNDGTGGGAATQLAAQAMSWIDGFSNAAGRPSSGPHARSPRGLSFSNIVNVDPPGPSKMGGGFGSMPCNKDYYETLAALPPAEVTGMGNSENANSSAVGKYYSRTGPLRLVGSGAIVAGEKKVIYVQGDVLIDQDIAYNTTGWNSENIPSFMLIVKGNIYIEKGVTRLDGIYIAQPDGASGGNIYTCARRVLPGNTGALPALDDSFYSFCNNQLVVNGTFIAEQIHLLRTVGTLRNGSNGEPAASPGIAEVFNFSPEVWMGPSVLPEPSGGTDYEAITSLPPIL